MMPGKIEKAEMLPILVRTEECAEKADALYKQMYNFIWTEHERGKSDIAEEDWNGIVRPLGEQAYRTEKRRFWRLPDTETCGQCRALVGGTVSSP